MTVAVASKRFIQYGNHYGLFFVLLFCVCRPYLLTCIGTTKCPSQYSYEITAICIRLVCWSYGFCAYCLLEVYWPAFRKLTTSVISGRHRQPVHLPLLKVVSTRNNRTNGRDSKEILGSFNISSYSYDSHPMYFMEIIECIGLLHCATDYVYLLDCGKYLLADTVPKIVCDGVVRPRDFKLGWWIGSQGLAVFEGLSIACDPWQSRVCTTSLWFWAYSLVRGATFS